MTFFGVFGLFHKASITIFENINNLMVLDDSKLKYYGLDELEMSLL